MTDHRLVTMVPDKTGSHPEPPFNPAEPEMEQLRWLAGLIYDQTGISIEVSVNRHLDAVHRYLGEDERSSQRFNIAYKNHVAGSLNYSQAWWYMTGIQSGWELRD